MEYGQILLAAVLFTLPVTWFNNHESILAESGFRAALRCWLKPRVNIWISLVLGIMGGSALTVLSARSGAGDDWQRTGVLFVYVWSISAAYCDGKARKIPNSWILYGMAAWGALWLARGLSKGDWTGGLADSLAGAIFGGSFFLLGSMIKKGGIGMGDVKLFTVLGLFCGWQRVLMLIAVSLAGAAVWAVSGILTGRLSRKDRLPIGPFAYAGLTAVILLGSVC